MMEKKILQEFPDGSQMLQLEDGRIAFAVDPDRFSFSHWSHNTMLAHMIRSHAHDVKIKSHIRSNFARIVQSQVGLLNPEHAATHIHHQLDHLMREMTYSRDVKDFRLNVGPEGGRLSYALHGSAEYTELTFEVDNPRKRYDQESIDAAVERALLGPAPKRDLVSKEEVEYYHSMFPAAPKFKNPIKKLSAKELVETQPMCTQLASPMAELRAQRKKDGLCPECGDLKRESAVGVCRDHGKFMG